MPNPFDRDFGYLLPFLDKLDAHARSLPGPAGDELRRLIAEEKPRWARIRGLLEGQPAAPAPARPPAAPLASGFTVGSLRIK